MVRTQSSLMVSPSSLELVGIRSYLAIWFSARFEYHLSRLG